ncbi:MAG: SAM-dependent methyltransferase [Firmicutes bacterium]|nr:SAM-dependent methyltransferase [Bacillota bacterium]
MFVSDGWQDYELMDTGDGERLERWGRFILRRPDPQVIWPATLGKKAWNEVHGHYTRSNSGGGRWDFLKGLPERWSLSYRSLKFYIRPTGFKHTGLFPEQAVNWDWLAGLIKTRTSPIRVLNLFAYTGGATLAAASAGAEVCHVDAAKGMVTWARENANLSNLADRPIRWLVDDTIKFVNREKRRGRLYHGVIMDPPSFGRGPNGEIWKIEDELYSLTRLCAELLTEEPLFFLINSYTTGLAPGVLNNILALTVGRRHTGTITAAEIGLPVTAAKLVLPCGASGRWEARE